MSKRFTSFAAQVIRHCRCTNCLKEFTIKKEIKVKGDDRYDNVRWLEDHGDDSFSKEYSTGSEDKHPITRRRTFHKTGMHLSTSIRIHSQILLEMLKEIIVPSLSPEYEQLYSQEVKFHQPYVILFQNRSGLQKALADEKDEQKTALLRLLLDFLEKERPNAWKKLDEIEAGTCEHISFEDAWLLYAPGTTIFARSSKTWEAYKVGEIEVKQLPQLGSIRINTYSLDFDHSGTKLVPAGDMLFMTPFTGTRLMSDLEVIPEAFLPDRETIVKDVRTRGEAFWEFNTHPAYRQYIGSAWPTTLASVSYDLNQCYLALQSAHQCIIGLRTCDYRLRLAKQIRQNGRRGWLRRHVGH